MIGEELLIKQLAPWVTWDIPGYLASESNGTMQDRQELRTIKQGAAWLGEHVARRGLGPDSSRIAMDGGTVRIDWDRATTHVTMTGPVAYVCEGVLSADMASLLEGRHGEA